MILNEKTISQDFIYTGRIITVRNDRIELPNGDQAEREVVGHPGGVCVAALTDNRELLFVRQYRYPYQKIVLEIPAGKLEAGEDPIVCGKRELLEETGMRPQTFLDFGVIYPTPGYCDEVLHLYFATGLTYIGQCLDDDEFLEVEKIPLDRALEMVLRGEIPDGKTQIAVLKTDAYLRRQQKQENKIEK